MSSAIFKHEIQDQLKRNSFNLSHERKYTCKMGELVPIMCEEVIPGDTWQYSNESIVKLAPLVAPTMHRINFMTETFFVPMRLIWDDWEDFITGGEDGQQSPVMPHYDLTNLYHSGGLNGALADYLGVQRKGATTMANGIISSLPFRAYQLIYNEYYRDQNLTDEVEIPLGSGVENEDPGGVTPLITLRNRSWEKDYFTSALPWTQKGDDVILPLGTVAPIEFKTSGTTPNDVRLPDGTLYGAGTLDVNASGELEHGSATPAVIDNHLNLETDLSNATSATINDFRQAMALQRWLERNARGGTRYNEFLLAHFGVRSKDSRLQRPEFLGASKNPIVISEVLQTGETGGTPQANMAGHAVGNGYAKPCVKFMEEHGYIITIASILPKTAYQQGIRRHFFKTDKFDFFNREFVGLGEQPVFIGELYAAPSAEVTDVYEEFGYQSRYCEYKYIPSTVHGEFRDTSALMPWHMGRIFENKPQLNDDFIQSDPTTRIYADLSGQSDYCYVMLYNDVKVIRPLPTFAKPGL